MAELRRPSEVVEEVARGMALDLLHMLMETDELDDVLVQANYTGGYPSVSWHGIRDGETVWRTHLVGEREVPTE